jgi:N-acyl-D-amino-acid deacylase
MASYSIIIKNGTVFTGEITSSGDKKNKLETDIGIKDGKITAIGNLQDKLADTVIDAKDKYVTPGFVDITTHSDTHWSLFNYPAQESFLRQGVTTIIGGHGGISLAPIFGRDELDMIAKWVDTNQTNLNWQTFGEYLTELSDHELGVNFGSFVGLENIRRTIMKKETGQAGKKEMKEMCELLKRCFEEGAFGLSTNLGIGYSRSFSPNELTEIFSKCHEEKNITTHHLEDEGKNILPSISRLIMLLRNSGARGHITHFKTLGRKAWDDFENAVNMIELAQSDGINITCDFFPYNKTGSALSTLLPSWLTQEPNEKILQMLDDNKIKQSIVEYLESLTLHYEKIMIAYTLKDIGATGKTIKELSEFSDMTPEEILIDLIKVNEMQVSIFNEVIMPDHLEILSQKNYISVSSDGTGYDLEKIISKSDLAHPRSFGTFAKFINQFVKEKSLVSWESAVYKMSGLPANILGLEKRGKLEKGYFADVLVIDPVKISDKSTYENPWQYSDGMEHVIVNGSLAIHNGQATNLKSGTVVAKK